MSARTAQTVIDSLEFARAAKELRGQLLPVDLARLRDCLYDDGSRIDFLLKGGRDHQKRSVLRLEIWGLLRLQCQRCLGRLDYPLQILNSLLLVREDEAAAADTDDPNAPDCIVADTEMDAAALIEDEILLSLPLSPRHPDGACSVNSGSVQFGHEASPFARLVALKK